MSKIFRWLLLVLAYGMTINVFAGTIFTDGFETGTLSPPWSITSFYPSVVSESTSYHQTGTASLFFTTSSASFTLSEATLTVDLTNKRNVVLSFWAMDVGPNTANAPPTGIFTLATRNFDGVSISTNGTQWQTVQTLAGIGSSWTQYTVPLDAAVAALGTTFRSNFEIRFSQYDRFTFVTPTGLAIDDVSLTADDDYHLSLQFPSNIKEGDTGQATLRIPAPLAADLVVALTTSTPLSVPNTVTIPAGQITTSFSYSVQDDSLVNFSRSVAVLMSVAGKDQGSASVVIGDNEPAPTLSISLPNSVTEGVSNSSNATVTLSSPGDVPLVVTLASSPASQLVLPATVTIPAGQTQVAFMVNANADSKIDGNVTATVTASGPGVAAVSGQVVAIDTDPRVLTLSLPAIVNEGGTATGSVRTGLPVGQAFTVHLASSDPGNLSLPSTVTVTAGSNTASFVLTAPDNSVKDGSRTVNITATADTFTSAAQSTIVRDNEVVAYRLSTSMDSADIIDTSTPLTVTVTAVDIEGNVIGNAQGTLNLFVVLADGTSLPLTPASVTLSGTGWTGSVTLPPAAASTGISIRAVDGSGLSASGITFDNLKTVALTAADLVWDSSRNVLYASVPASSGDSHANQIVVIDPTSGQITGSVTVGSDPGRLAVTSGGEYLYVALKTTKQIARVNLATMSVDLTFAVGTDPSDGAVLTLRDMTTVAGQPNVIIVSRLTTFNSFRSVAAFDNGIMRPTVFSSNIGAVDVFAPSSDPLVFYGYNNETSGFELSRIKLDANGVTRSSINSYMLNSYNLDIRSMGDRVFATDGSQVDGAQMRRLGAWKELGPVCADASVNRVYFMEVGTGSFLSYKYIVAYDPATFALVRTLTLPSVATSAFALVRWGQNGLAFCAGSTVYLVASNRLVPPYTAPADLSITAAAAPTSTSVSRPLTYTITVTNHGPNVARNAQVLATLSSGQTLQNVVPGGGTFSVNGSVVTVAAGDLASGATVSVTITTSPQSAGTASCSVETISDSTDADFSNNTASASAGVGYRTATEFVNTVQLPANNLLFDSTRNLFWASIPSGSDPILARKVVTVDPRTGVVTPAYSVVGNPASSCMALSANGRYLYVGLADVPEMHCIDLSTGVASRFLLDANSILYGNYAADVEVLDGDGTSVLVTSSGYQCAAVYDNGVRRSALTDTFSVVRIARAAAPGTFFGYESKISPPEVSRMAVTSSGITTAAATNTLVSLGNMDIAGDGGNLFLFSSGLLVDGQTLTAKFNFGVAGRPCLDSTNGRAMLVSGASVQFFDAATYANTGALALPVTSTGDWALQCVRWGLDGIAVLGGDGKLYVGRTTNCIPQAQDLNHNGIPDAWEIANFGSYISDPAADPTRCGLPNAFSYLFGVTPGQGTASPLQTNVALDGANQPVIRMVFPRRSGLSSKPYRIDLSSDLLHWAPAQSVTENVLSTQIVGGISIDSVECLITPLQTSACFTRLVWTGGTSGP